ncbi:unnamed protein product, partial [Ectocarpus sp. 12 AP-2014]
HSNARWDGSGRRTAASGQARMATKDIQMDVAAADTVGRAVHEAGMTGDVGAMEALTGQLALTCSPLSGALVSMGSAILSHGLAAVADAPIQTGSGGDVTEYTAGAVTERTPIQTGSGGDVAELAASAVTEAICNAC